MMSDLKLTALFVLATAIAGIAVMPPAKAETFRTKSFSIDIQVNCAEGNVTCDNVTYVGRNLRTGKTIRLKGKTIHTLGTDGVPHRFIGYEFHHKEYVYLVNDADRKLEVYRNDKRIFTEQSVSADRNEHHN